MTLVTAGTPAAPRPPRRREGAPRIGIVVAVLLVAVVASVFVGAEMVPPDAFFSEGSFENAVLKGRVVRTATALVVGAALGLGGACLQGLTRNPLADSGLLGLNAGAAFAVVTAISYAGTGALGQQLWFAFLGTAAAGILVHGAASFGPGGATPAKLVLAGAAVTAALASWTTALLLSDHRTFDVIRRWQVGAIASDGGALATAAPFLVVGGLLALASARVLDTLALGDELARGLGRRLGVDRLLVGVAIVLLVGTATALAGPIAFVGLIVPHGVRGLVGSSHAFVLPLSAAGGAALVALADTVGRIILPPQEVQVGIMAAVLGVPAFLWLLRRGRRAGV